MSDIKGISFYKKIAFSAATIIMVLICGEIVSRAILFNYPSIGTQPYPFEADLPKEFATVNNKTATAPPVGDLAQNADRYFLYAPNRPYRVITNNVGVRRVKDISIVKPNDLFRIYCLGDSFTFGPYLANEDTYPSLLEAVLGERIPGMAVEVLNAGIAGYFMKQEAELFITRGYRSQPDLVILQALDNDVPDYKEENRFPRPPIRGSGLGGKVLATIKDFLRNASKRLALIRFIREIRLRLIVGYQAPDNPPQRNVDPNEIMVNNPDQQRNVDTLDIWKNHSRTAELERYKHRYEKDFKKLLDFTNRNDIPVLVAYFPTQKTLEWWRSGDDPAEEYYRMLSRKHNVDYLDLSRHFDKGEQTNNLYLWPWNGHMSMLGNYTAAKALATVVESYVNKHTSAPAGYGARKTTRTRGQQ